MSDPSEHLAEIQCKHSILPSFGDGALRVAPVFRHGPADSLNALCRFRARTESAMQPAPTIFHSWALTRGASSRLCPTASAGKSPEVSEQLPHKHP
jgi:hypothetical protein